MRKIPISLRLTLIGLATVLLVWTADRVMADGDPTAGLPNPWTIVTKIASENLAALLTGVLLATWFVYSKEGISDRIKTIENDAVANNKLLLAIAAKLNINSLL